MPFAAMSWGNLYFEQHGSGRALLLIPGRGLDIASWAAQIPIYKEHFRVIVYDPRGSGRSQSDASGFGVVDLASDAEALLASLGITEAHVAGFSLGGMTAIHVALRRRVRLISLSLHSTVDRAYAHLRLRQAISLRILDHDDADLWAMFSAFTAFGGEFINDSESIVQEEIQRRINRWKGLSLAEKAGVRAQIVAAMTHDVAETALHLVAAPTLVTVGSSDEVTRPEYASRMAAEIPGAELVVFRGGPHRVPTFMPEEFNQKTLAFLLKHNRAGGEIGKQKAHSERT